MKKFTNATDETVELVEPKVKGQTLLLVVTGGLSKHIKYVTTCNSSKLDITVKNLTNGMYEPSFKLADWIVYHNITSINYLTLDNYVDSKNEMEYLKWLFIDEYDAELNELPKHKKKFNNISEERKQQLYSIFVDIKFPKDFKNYNLAKLEDFKLLKKIYSYDPELHDYDGGDYFDDDEDLYFGCC